MRSCEDYVVERLENMEMTNDALMQTAKALRAELEEQNADMVKLLGMFDTAIFTERDGSREERFTMNYYQTVHVGDPKWDFLCSLFDKYGVEREKLEDDKRVCCDGCSCSKGKTENN